MILTIGTTKGGVGKTTLAIQLAVEAARGGVDVELIDADRQGTAMAALAMREQAGVTPAVRHQHCTTAAALAAALEHSPAGRLTLIDAGGRDSETLRAALVSADRVVMPYGPRSYDIWGLEDMAELLTEARAAGAILEAWALLNGADPGGAVLARDNREAAAAAAEIEGITAIDPARTRLGRRKAFASAAGDGLSVHELPVRFRDPKAERELAAAYRVVMAEEVA